MDEVSNAAVLAAITDHQAALRSLLEGHERAILATRPANRNWSAVENVRHLLFAEQGHLGRFVPRGLGLSPMGQLQKRLQDNKRVAIVGTNPTTDLAAVYDEWERVRAAACQGMDLAHPELRDLLPCLPRHQQTHGNLAVRALRHVKAQGSASRP